MPLMNRVFQLLFPALVLVGCDKPHRELKEEVPRLKMNPEELPKGTPSKLGDSRMLSGSEPVLTHSSPAVTPNGILSLQPLLPGLTWTYRLKSFGAPWVIRCLSSDLNHRGPMGTMKESTGPMNEWGPLGDEVRYTVTSETQLLTEGKTLTTFYRIRTETKTNGIWNEVLNGLFWGRVKLSYTAFGIFEMRELKAATAHSELLRTFAARQDSKGIMSRPMFHSLLLTGDVVLNKDAPAFVNAQEFSMGSFSQKTDHWVFEFNPRHEWTKIAVPAGEYNTVKSITKIEGEGSPFESEREMDTVVTAYYAFKVGLVKWEQHCGGKLRCSAELSEFTAQK